MPLEPAIEKEVATWLFKATEDLRAAQVDLKAEPPLLNDSLFHCQQACEKALKSLLCCLQTPFRKVHDLNELGNLCFESIFYAKFRLAFSPWIILCSLKNDSPYYRQALPRLEIGSPF